MLWKKPSKPPEKIGLILSGGGARAAYQVGVLKAFAEILPKESTNPFPIICGTSAGAINAAALAIYSKQFREAVWRLVHVWGNFHVDHVFRSDVLGLSSSIAHWFAMLASGGLGQYNPVALLDRAPLSKLLGHYLPFEKIQESIDGGTLEALSITASNYTNGYSVVFFQGHESIEPWHRTRRMGLRTNIDMQHLMASSAIPIVFKPELINGQYYGDGSMRQTAPLSPALHLGANRVVVIGVKHAETDMRNLIAENHPSLGQITGHVLDSIFLDNIDMDVERMQRINKTLSQIPDKHIPDTGATMRKIDILNIAPTQDLYQIAEKHFDLMPRGLRFFLRGLGVSKQRGSNLLSYLLFEKLYCRDLIALGYGDAMNRRREIVEFFDLAPGAHLPIAEIDHNA